jgi:hypothetical protein
MTFFAQPARFYGRFAGRRGGGLVAFTRPRHLLGLSLPLGPRQLHTERAGLLPRRALAALELTSNHACFCFLPHQRLQETHVLFRPRSRLPRWFRHRCFPRNQKTARTSSRRGRRGLPAAVRPCMYATANTKRSAHHGQRWLRPAFQRREQIFQLMVWRTFPSHSEIMFYRPSPAGAHRRVQLFWRLARAAADTCRGCLQRPVS